MHGPEARHAFHRPDGHRRLWLGVLVVAWGSQAIVTQSLLLREALVLMFGSEFAWGVVLFAWLLGVAVGAAVGGRLAERLRRPELGLVLVLVILSATACVELWAFRGARAWLGVEPGELLPLPKTALAALWFVSPASALVGMAFPLACCVGKRAVWPADDGRPERAVEGGGPQGAPYRSAPHGGHCLSFGHVYALESAGSLIGGAAFSFWAVEHLSPIETALLCGALTAAAAAGLALALRRGAGELKRSLTAPIALAILAVGAALLALVAGAALNRWLVERRWRNIAPGYELVAQTESKYQNLAIGRLAGQYTLYCDGQVAADFPDPYSFGPLAHFWLCQHPEPRRVLLLGGGAEGLLSEILRHPVERVDYVELDPQQIELIKPYLAETDRRALADPRVAVHHVDARYFVKTQRGRFDLVIARLPEPTSALRARLYTDEFFGELRRVMTARAVLCTTAAAAPGELAEASREYLASIRATLRRHFPQLIIGWGHPAHILAATADRLLSIDPAELAARYRRRGVESPLFHPAWFEGATDWLDPEKLARRRADLDEAREVEISTDLRPSVYVQRLVLWEAATSASLAAGGGGTNVIEWLQSVKVAELAAVLAAIGVITLLLCRLRYRSRAGWASGTIALSVGTTGFATMALSIVWLFAFQNLYGYVYQRIGWIIALFMAGLVIGCWLGSWWSSRPTEAAPPALQTRGNAAGNGGRRSGGRCPSYGLWRSLMLVDVLLALLALSAPFVLPALGGLQRGATAFAIVEWCVSLLVVATGVLGGAAFPLAGRLQLGATGRAGAAAGAVVAADHAGACLGALLCGILLVPVFGTAVAAFLLAGTKLVSAAALGLGRQFAAAR
jgi:spermidine synthase